MTKLRLEVLRGRGIVHSTPRYEQGLNTIAQVLVDLMHFAAADGKNFDQELKKAQILFQQQDAEDLQERRKKKAEEAFASQEFDPYCVKDTDGWVQNQEDRLECNVFLEGEYEPYQEGESRKVRFIVEFAANSDVVVCKSVDWD